jgi:hypothetical protein
MVQFQMPLPLLDSRALKSLINTMRDPRANNFIDGRLRARCMNARGNLMARGDVPFIGVFLQIEGLQPALAMLIDVIDHPGSPIFSR